MAGQETRKYKTVTSYNWILKSVRALRISDGESLLWNLVFHKAPNFQERKGHLFLDINEIFISDDAEFARKLSSGERYDLVYRIKDWKVVDVIPHKLH